MAIKSSISSFCCRAVMQMTSRFFFHKFKEMVELMPNLKVLRNINYTCITDSEEPLLLEPLEKEIQSNPFPELTKLEVNSFETTPSVLRNYLINRHHQISRLVMVMRVVTFTGKCAFFPNELHTLSPSLCRGLTRTKFWMSWSVTHFNSICKSLL